MEVLSLIGMVISILVLAILCIKRVHTLIAAVVASIIVALFSGMNPLLTITDTYMTGVAGFLKNYILLFVLSCIFGKVMTECGALKRIAELLARLARLSKKPITQKFLGVFVIVLLYFILTYVGINGFVTVFAVLGISYELWTELDVPLEFYPYGSAGIIPGALLGGSLYSGNIMTMNAFGTSATSGFLYSLFMAVVIFVVLGLIIRGDVVRYHKRGEGFLPSGAELKKNPPSTGLPLEQCAPAASSIICMIIPLACIILGLNVLVSLLIGIIACMLINLKYFDKKRIYPCVGEGVVSGTSAIIGCAGVLGCIYVYQATAGYQLMLNSIDLLPALYGGILLGMFGSAVTGSIANWMPALLPSMMDKFVTQSGLSAALAHRLSMITPMLYTVPHNSGDINSLNLTKINQAKGWKHYWKGNLIPSLVAVILTVLLIQIGVFV